MTQSTKRILAIGLDAFEIGLAESMMAEGILPNLQRLYGESARFLLDHGRGKYTGLAWEHFSTGLSPDDQGRWSTLEFDPISYKSVQSPTTSKPFLAELDSPVVIFDVPYFDLDQTGNVIGLTSWGAHDPGTQARSCPNGLEDEILSRFGTYPADDWVYGFSWPCAERTQTAGSELCKALDTRTQIMCWLLGDYEPDWQLGLVVVSETHSGIEQFWHGVDPNHPLHELPSGAPARQALRNIYMAADRMIGTLQETFPDAILMVFSMHGMGTNKSDLPAMFLVPELLHRYAFGKPYARDVAWPDTLASGQPLLGRDDSWEQAMQNAVPMQKEAGHKRNFVQRALSKIFPPPKANLPQGIVDIDWMPAARYSEFWPKMQAFALPAYYDIQIRINLAGREGMGIVPTHAYDQVCEDVVDLLGECRDPLSGKPVVERVVKTAKPPNQIGGSQADLYITPAMNTTGLIHPKLGQIGPVPYRRTGGHTGDWGFFYVRDPDLRYGDRGTAEAFDVAPTICDLLGARLDPKMSGNSLAPRLREPSDRDLAEIE